MDDDAHSSKRPVHVVSSAGPFGALPQPVVFSIFEMLPYDDLARFSCVSTWWNHEVREAFRASGRLSFERAFTKPEGVKLEDVKQICKTFGTLFRTIDLAGEHVAHLRYDSPDLIAEIAGSGLIPNVETLKLFDSSYDVHFCYEYGMEGAVLVQLAADLPQLKSASVAIKDSAEDILQALQALPEPGAKALFVKRSISGLPDRDGSDLAGRVGARTAAVINVANSLSAVLECSPIEQLQIEDTYRDALRELFSTTAAAAQAPRRPQSLADAAARLRAALSSPRTGPSTLRCNDSDDTTAHLAPALGALTPQSRLRAVRTHCQLFTPEVAALAHALAPGKGGVEAIDLRVSWVTPETCQEASLVAFFVALRHNTTAKAALLPMSFVAGAAAGQAAAAALRGNSALARVSLFHEPDVMRDMEAGGFIRGSYPCHFSGVAAAVSAVGESRSVRALQLAGLPSGAVTALFGMLAAPPPQLAVLSVEGPLLGSAVCEVLMALTAAIQRGGPPLRLRWLGLVAAAPQDLFVLALALLEPDCPLETVAITFCPLRVNQWRKVVRSPLDDALGIFAVTLARIAACTPRRRLRAVTIGVPYESNVGPATCAALRSVPGLAVEITEPQDTSAQFDAAARAFGA